MLCLPKFACITVHVVQDSLALSLPKTNLSLQTKRCSRKVGLHIALPAPADNLKRNKIQKLIINYSSILQPSVSRGLAIKRQISSKKNTKYLRDVLYSIQLRNSLFTALNLDKHATRKKVSFF